MPDEITIELPLPPERLHPNSRLKHFAGLSKLVANARGTAKLLTRQSLPVGWESLIDRERGVELAMTFYMPRRRDDDNLVAWTKSYRDGVADALIMSDARFKTCQPEQVTGKAANGQRKLVIVVRRSE